MLIFNLFARDQPISEGEREQKNKVVDIHSERMRASERARERERKEKHRFLFLFFFYLIMYIQSLITTVVFPICQCRISRSFLLSN